MFLRLLLSPRSLLLWALLGFSRPDPPPSLVGRVETTAFLSSSISSGATAKPTMSAADDGEASFEIGGGR